MRMLLVTVAAAAWCGMLEAAPALRPTVPLVVYAAGPSGDVQIFAVRLDGGEARALTKTPGNNLFPAVSPDGQRIAYTSDPDGVQQIFVMDADGKNAKAITSGTEASRGPAWSPDGKRIVFTRHVEGQFPNIFVMDADGKDVEPLTKGTEYTADPAWSPDGKRIAYTVLKTGSKGFRVYTMAADGKDVKQVTTEENPFGFVYPAWSPDGKQIAYADMAENHIELFLIDADGKNRRQMTRLKGQSGYPTWTSDGKRVVFYHVVPGGESSIRVINADGSNDKIIVKDTKSPPEGGRVTLRH